MFRRRKREPLAPDQDAVVGRLLCISVVAMLGAIAAALAEGTADEGQAAEYVTESHRWLIREKLVDHLSSSERTLIAKPLAEWTQQELTNASLRNESLGVLLWALSALEEIPPYDAGFERLPALVPLLAPTSDFRERASLRPPDVIGRARDVAYDKPDRALDADEYAAVTSSAAERHYALNWLCGYASDWDRVPTDT
jgi:hypothetical protein